MRTAFLAPLALCAHLLLPAAAQAQAAKYELDPDHTTVAFLVDHIGYAKILGMFRSVRGSYSFDEATATLTNENTTAVINPVDSAMLDRSLSLTRRKISTSRISA